MVIQETPLQAPQKTRRTSSSKKLIVDLNERRSDRTPRDIYEAAQHRINGLADVDFCTLKLGDYAWLQEDFKLGACRSQGPPQKKPG